MHWVILKLNQVEVLGKILKTVAPFLSVGLIYTIHLKLKLNVLVQRNLPDQMKYKSIITRHISSKIHS